MNPDQRTIVGVDGSGFSTAALRLAGRMATGFKAQMLVVGRRGQGGFLAPVRGSASGASAARAHCPVLVVGQDTEAQRASRGMG
jgi:nucleotide-binding universal stress UspA family protein